MIFILMILTYTFNFVWGIDFIHQNDIVKSVKKKIKEVKSYKANFTISSSENKQSITSGLLYYKEPHFIRMSFSNPPRDLIISNGQTLWVFIHTLNAVAVQKLDSSKKSSSTSLVPSLAMFDKYHITFEDIEQPRKINNVNSYVLHLKERVGSGSFHTLNVYINANTYLIYKIIGKKLSGETIQMNLNKINTNLELENHIFSFKIKENMQIVKNPLTIK